MKRPHDVSHRERRLKVKMRHDLIAYEATLLTHNRRRLNR